MMPGLLEAPALFMPSDSEFPRIGNAGNRLRIRSLRACSATRRSKFKILSSLL